MGKPIVIADIESLLMVNIEWIVNRTFEQNKEYLTSVLTILYIVRVIGSLDWIKLEV